MAACGEPDAVRCPFTRTLPASACSRPQTMRIRVVLPAPFSPTTAWIEPCGTVRPTPSFATTASNRLVSPCTSRWGAADATLIGLLLREEVGVALLDHVPDLNLAALDLLGQLIDLVDVVARHRFVNRAQLNAAGLQVETYDLAAWRSVNRAFNGHVDRVVSPLD